MSLVDVVEKEEAARRDRASTALRVVVNGVPTKQVLESQAGSRVRVELGGGAGVVQLESWLSGHLVLTHLLTYPQEGELQDGKPDGHWEEEGYDVGETRFVFSTRYSADGQALELSVVRGSRRAGTSAER